MAAGRKTGKRVKGTSNKLTKELRVLLKDILHQELENLPKYLNSLEPKERLEILVKLLPYAIPKVESVHYKENEPDPSEWNEWF